MNKIERLVRIVTDEGCIIAISDFDDENVEISVAYEPTASPYFSSSKVIIPRSQVFDVGKILHESFDE